MKVRIELDPQMDEPEMIIRAPRLTEDVARLQQLILEQKMTPLTFYKDRSEYFVDVSEILFFETDGEKIYGRSVKNSTNWKKSCRLLSVASPSRPSSIPSRFMLSKNLFREPVQ